MRRAAFEAGLIPDESSGRLELALEPEAACVACEAESAALAAGDAFMMLDCGGGTADITVHRVARAAPELRLDELRRPSGGPWGSAFVDAEFEAFLQRLVGGGAFRRLQASPSWVEAMRAWEAVKLGCDPGASLSGDAAKAISMSGVLEVGMAVPLLASGWGELNVRVCRFGNLGMSCCQRRGGLGVPGPFFWMAIFFNFSRWHFSSAGLCGVRAAAAHHRRRRARGAGRRWWRGRTSKSSPTPTTHGAKRRARGARRVRVRAFASCARAHVGCGCSRSTFNDRTIKELMFG